MPAPVTRTTFLESSLSLQRQPASVSAIALLYQFDVERHEDASRHGEALERIESSGQHCLVRERALKALIDQPKLEAAKQVLDD